MSQKKETLILLLTFLITIGCLGLGLWGFMSFFADKTKDSSNLPTNSQQTGNFVQQRLSQGSKILINANLTPEKEAGVKAFAEGDFEKAISLLETSLKSSSNDPETLIYLNNARAILKTNPWKIAVSVPIGGNLNVAQEILRGVAQAQNQLNQQGGVKGRLLEVVIANDDNNDQTAKEVAQSLIQDTSILAVVGHNSSSASLATAPIYIDGKLVAISPTSYSSKLSGISPYFFRTVPSMRFSAENLADYIINKANLKSIGICWDSQDAVSRSVKDEMTLSLLAKGGKITNTSCDFSQSNFNPNEVSSQIIADGGEGILLAPSVNKMNQAVDVAKANQGRLHLFGSPTIYTGQILQQGQDAVKGMVLAVPWHPDSVPNNPFPENALKLWGGRVNWRTAMAYDATMAITETLKQTDSRDGIQAILARSDFSFEGATGRVEFLPGFGDRKGGVQLVKIEVVPNSPSGTDYDFVPIGK